jgi:hypothetical protein
MATIERHYQAVGRQTPEIRGPRRIEGTRPVEEATMG